MILAPTPQHGATALPCVGAAIRKCSSTCARTTTTRRNSWSASRGRWIVAVRSFRRVWEAWMRVKAGALFGLLFGAAITTSAFGQIGQPGQAGQAPQGGG